LPRQRPSESIRSQKPSKSITKGGTSEPFSLEVIEWMLDMRWAWIDGFGGLSGGKLSPKPLTLTEAGVETSAASEANCGMVE